MILIVGLGNPGKKFIKTRHNLGFLVIEKFARKNNFPDFKFSKKFNAEISKGKIDHKSIILAKPQTFMNKSGQSVRSLIDYYLKNRRKIKAMAVILRRFENLWVIHDDIDLPIGKIRISKGRGSAGHKGVQSIIDEIGTKEFVRFRVGIRPKKIENRKQKTETLVLQKFTKEEEKIIKKAVERTCLAIKLAIIKGIGKAMAEFNKRNKKPRHLPI